MLQKVLETEPERLLPQLTESAPQVLAVLRDYLGPTLDERERAAARRRRRRGGGLPGPHGPVVHPRRRSAGTSTDPAAGPPTWSATQLLAGILADG